MDRFKYVNDTLGHPIGDKLLKQVSRRLKKCLGDHNMLARLGGDEFAVVLPNIRNTNQVIEHAKTIIESLEDPFHIDEYKLFITTSIGISIFPNDGEDFRYTLKACGFGSLQSKRQREKTLIKSLPLLWM